MDLPIANLFYLIAAILFILGLKGLTHPRRALRGNALGALGMLVAVVTAAATELNLNWGLIIAGLLVGGVIGGWLAVKIEMTAMPQLVALFNGFGGGASLLVATSALIQSPSGSSGLQMVIASLASAFIGAVTLTGSLVAYAKLQRLLKKNLAFPGQKLLNALLTAGILICAGYLVIQPGNPILLWAMIAAAALLGVLLVMPIGGADMPVVIAALNSYSGLAAGAAGFVLNNTVLITSGALVGASGIILTRIMCRAMNRSFQNVIFGLPMGESTDEQQDEIYEGRIKSTSSEEIAMILESARKVVIVPGYGMAVSQAQYAVRDLTALLEERKIEVDFAIHPVAGRMPGHMNVLLAEADIPYEKLKDLETSNPAFPQTDVAIVIGANDVVNPVARDAAGSPISGMPILNVDQARSVIVIKRSLSPGFAGIANPLFAADNTMMYFTDGKEGINQINAALKEG